MSLRSVCARTETAFVDTGRALSEAVETLSVMGGQFEAIVDQLQGPATGDALTDLAWTARQVSGMGGGGKPCGLALLRDPVDRLLGDIDRMAQHAAAVDPLTINAKIVAADLAASEIDVSAFAGEISRTLTLSRQSLGQCRDGLETMRRQIGAALAGQLEADERRDAAARSIPPRLDATLAALAARHQQAREAAGLARQRNEGARRSVCDLIAAMQIGDSTRQRIEHVQAALSALSASLAACDGTDPADTGSVTLRVICRLQAAQLNSAGEQYRRETGIVAEALDRLTEEAEALRRTGQGAFGDGDQGGGAVEGPVTEALAIFADFEAARSEARRVLGEVSAATARQSRHLDSLRDVEADLRIMGLNTALKCARIGQRGRALSMIAQELRLYARQFGRDAEAVFGNVGLVAREAATMAAGGEGDDGAPGIVSEIQAAMTRAMSALREVGRTLETSSGILDRDGARVASLLAATAAGLAGQGEIGLALCETASRLEAMAGEASLPADLPPPAEAMLAEIARSYTMAEERLVHARILAIDPSELSPMAAAAPQTVDDMLF